MNFYESNELLQQYLVFHYAKYQDQFPYSFGGIDALGFPERCVSEGIDHSLVPENAHALDLGCSVGRSSFELARFCDKVVGIDYSQSFIDAANHLKAEGSHSTLRSDEGSKTTKLQVAVSPEIKRSHVFFEQGDAMNIRSDIGQFEIVIACNLICRLREPMKLLSRLPELVKSGGQLFITTPFTWMEEYTPPNSWLGNGDQDSFAGLRASLEPHFTLHKKWDMPFLIREHARKFQYSIAQASRWIRLN